ncbi:MAG: hypothetical protein AABY07_08420 [Nanoarchaeota archaeon]
MSVVIEKDVEEILLRDEAKIVQALEEYYENFRGDGTGMTFNWCARKRRLNPGYVIDYQFFRKEYRLGMPGDREEAQEYLNNLRRLKEDLRIF